MGQKYTTVFEMKWLLKEKAPFSNGQTDTRRSASQWTVHCDSVFQNDLFRRWPMHSTWQSRWGRLKYIAELTSRTPLIQEQMWCRKMRWATRTVPSIGAVSALLFHFKNRQVLQQPVQSCILALLNTSAACGYIEHHGALQFKFKIITWMDNT